MLVAGATGILLNDTMDDFSAQPGVPNVYGLIGSEANAIAPRKRPLSSMTPTIVTRAGRVAAVAGGSGRAVHHQRHAAGAAQRARVRAGCRQRRRGAADARSMDAALSDGRARYRRQRALGVAPARASRRRRPERCRGAARAACAPTGSLDGAADPRKGGVAVGWWARWLACAGSCGSRWFRAAAQRRAAGAAPLRDRPARSARRARWSAARLAGARPRRLSGEPGGQRLSLGPAGTGDRLPRAVRAGLSSTTSAACT